MLEKGTLNEILPLSWNSQPVRMDTDPVHPRSLQRLDFDDLPTRMVSELKTLPTGNLQGTIRNAFIN